MGLFATECELPTLCSLAIFGSQARRGSVCWQFLLILDNSGVQGEVAINS